MAPRELNRPSKVQEFDEFVSWDKPSLAWAGALFAELRARPRGVSLWPFHQQRALYFLKLAACQLCLPYETISLYMLRHGGASHDALCRLRTIEQIKQRGRWLSDRSVKRYQKATRSQQLAAALDPQVLRFASLVENRLPELMLQVATHSPPPRLTPRLTGA